MISICFGSFKYVSFPENKAADNVCKAYYNFIRVTHENFRDLPTDILRPNDEPFRRLKTGAYGSVRDTHPDWVADKKKELKNEKCREGYYKR